MSESRIKTYSVLATIAAATGSTLVAKYYLYDKKKERHEEHEEKTLVENVLTDIQKFSLLQTITMSLGLWYTGSMRRNYIANNCKPDLHAIVSSLDIAGGLAFGTLSFGVNAASWFDGSYNQTFGIACILFQIATVPDNIYGRFQSLFTLLDRASQKN